MTEVPPDVLGLAVHYGVPSSLLVAAWWVVPKLWKAISTKLAISQTSDELAKAGIEGVNGVVTLMTQQFKDLEQKLKDMSATVDQALKAKLIAEQDAAKAKSDLYAFQLYVERLRAQISSLGATPIPGP